MHYNDEPPREFDSVDYTLKVQQPLEKQINQEDNYDEYVDGYFSEYLEPKALVE